MTDLEAIQVRTSRRTYLETPMKKDNIQRIKECIDEANKASGLSITFMEDGSEAFNSIGKSYGMFKGVRSIILLKGEKSDLNLKEKSGYYGEKIVLEATKLGLGTCWVGGSFSKASLVIPETEDLICVLTIGNVAEDRTLKEKLINHAIHRKTKTVEEFYQSKGEVPDWFIGGMKAVQRAPSAINSQKVRFQYMEEEVKISIPDTHPFDLIDLGIAKLHFELSCGLHFDLGNPAVINISET